MASTQLDAPERLRRRLEDRVRRFAAEESLMPAPGPLLVAVSGGPDSTALLLILARLARRGGSEVVAAYFDHRLRGPEAGAVERNAVEALTASMGVRLVCGCADVRALARAQKRSLEEAARRARYAFLAEAACEVGASAVATGHTASDQAETVLLHLLRGAGLTGLGGMAARVAWPFAGHEGLALVRPLLALSRAETLAYCAAVGVTPIEDASNASGDYRRNRVRHQLLPAMRTFNPRVEAALVRLADAARLDAAYLDNAASAAVERQGKDVLLERERVGGLPTAMRPHVLRSAVVALLGDAEGFSARHLLALERLLTRGRTGDAIDLPRAVVARLERDVLVLSLGATAIVPLPDNAVCLDVPGEVRFGPLRVVASLDASAPGLRVDAAALGARVIVRRRRAGDRMQPAVMAGTKKLQDIFVDAHIARAQRDAIPVFETQRGIVAVGDLRVADWARPAGKPTVTLHYEGV